jgi:hypothetical protein
VKKRCHVRMIGELENWGVGWLDEWMVGWLGKYDSLFLTIIHASTHPSQ